MFLLNEGSHYPYPVGALFFEDVPRRIGTYILPIPGGNGTLSRSDIYDSFEYGDVVGPDYLLDLSEERFISIDAYDPSSCTIQGAFALTVIRERPRDVHRHLDTLRFSEGRFYTHVITRIR